jgi:hypothetical protein
VSLDVGDRLELHELVSHYGDIVDQRAWELLGEVFTVRASFEVAERIDVRGLEEIRTALAASDHPDAHLFTNVRTRSDGTGAGISSRLLAVFDDGRLGFGEYHDHAVRTSSGWRIADRHISFRRIDGETRRAREARERQRIRELVARCALAADDHDVDALLDCFDPSARVRVHHGGSEIETSIGPTCASRRCDDEYEGRDALRSLLGGVGRDRVHRIDNVVAEVHGHDARAVVHGSVTIREPGGDRLTTHVTRSEDRLRRDRSGWSFVERSVTVLWSESRLLTR